MTRALLITFFYLARLSCFLVIDLILFFFFFFSTFIIIIIFKTLKKSWYVYSDGRTQITLFELFPPRRELPRDLTHSISITNYQYFFFFKLHFCILLCPNKTTTSLYSTSQLMMMTSPGHMTVVHFSSKK